jgi:hypothetical protein
MIAKIAEAFGVRAAEDGPAREEMERVANRRADEFSSMM